MNITSRGARRTLSFVCSTAVVAAGASFFAAAPASATTGLSISGSTSITTLDFGKKISATLTQDATNGAGTGVLADNYEAAAYAYHVTSTLSSTASKIALVLDSYTQPSGIAATVATGSDGTSVTNAALVYAEHATLASTTPANTWKSITTGNAGTNYYLTDPLSQAHVRDTYVSATQPGTYAFHFVDTGASLAGADDDITSSTVTMTVLDAFAATSGATNVADDWAPTVSLSSSALKLGAPLSSTVPLSALSVSDARGSSSAVGILAKKLGALIGFQFDGSTATADNELGYRAVADLVTNSTVTATSATAAFTSSDVGRIVTAVGVPAGTTISAVGSATSITLSAAATASATVAATFISPTAYYVTKNSAGADWGYSSANNVYGASSVSTTVPANTLVTASTITATAGIDQAGLGTFLTATPATALSNSPTAAYTTSDVTGWNWGPGEVVGSIAAGSTSTVAVKTATASVTYTATVTAPSTALSGQTVYFTIAPGSTNDTVSANGTLVSSNSATGQKVYSVTTDSTGVASLTVTPSATAAAKSYTVKANLNGVAATAVAGTTLISTGNTTVTFAGSQPAVVRDTTPGADRYPAVGTANVTLTGQVEDQFGAVAQPDGTLTQNVKVTVAGVDAFVTPSAGKFSYTYTPSTAPSAGSTTSTTYTYTNTTPAISISDGGGLIHWVPATAAGTVTITAPADGASTGQTAAVGSAAPGGILVTGTVVDASSLAIPFKLVTLSGSDGAMFSTSATGATGITSTLQVGADSSGVFSAYVFYTKTGTATITATSDTKSDAATVTTTDAVDPYKVIVKDAIATPGGTVTISGEVKDAFGNPVPTEYVDLSIGSTGLGTLASSNPQTNSGGVFSTTFTTADSFSEGTATITAKLRATVNTAGAAIMTSNPTANSGWATAGVTVSHGEYMDQATLTVAKAQPTTISGPSSRTGAGSVSLHGKAVPGVVVEIYSRAAGSSAAFGWIDSVMSDESSGDWTASEYVSHSTTFIAKTSTSTSSALTVTVKLASVVVPDPKNYKLGAKPLGAGKVAITAVGNGDTRSTATIYILSGKTYKKVTTVRVDAKGVARATVKTSKGTRTFKVVYANSYKTATKIIRVSVK